MSPRSILALVVTVLGFVAVVAQAETGSSLRVQVFDQNGAPVRDAVIEIMPAEGVSRPIRFAWPMAMAQKNQQFVPHVLIVPRGSDVAFPNLDRVRHSIYSFSKPAKFQIDLYGRDQSRTQRFPIAGTVALGCNIHDQMKAYIRVVDTPFAAKTDSNGVVEFRGLPRGSARIVIWHPNQRRPNNEFATTFTVEPGTDTHRYKIALR